LNENAGYGAANNIGVKMSKTGVIVLINPDTMIQDKDFDIFIDEIQNEDIGVLAPKIVYPDGKVQPNCGAYATLKTYMMQAFKLGYFVRKFNLVYILRGAIQSFPFLKKSFIGTYLDNFSYDTVRKKCDWVSGACMIIRKEVFVSVGGFDENFFLYCEDEDLCRRIADRGYSIYIDTRFTVVHNEGFARSRKSRELTFAANHRDKSNIYYLQKYSGPFSAGVLRIFYAAQYFLSILIYVLFDLKAAKTYFKALPGLFKKVDSFDRK
jgi:GT2 family glycosyltransferase